MRLILKILAAPLVVALTLFVWICRVYLCAVDDDGLESGR